MCYDEERTDQEELEHEQEEKFELMEQFWANEEFGWPYPD